MSDVKELKAGLTHSESVVVEKELTVPEISPLFPAFTIMPLIFATPHLISLVESTCIIALRPYLTPEQRTVGVEPRGDQRRNHVGGGRQYRRGGAGGRAAPHRFPVQQCAPCAPSWARCAPKRCAP